MPDFGSPVAQNVNTNPMQGINTLSGILGLKQQQQQLQIQQAGIQTAQAQAGQQTLSLQAQQGTQDFFSSWNPQDDYDSSGVIDPDHAAQSDAYRNAPGNAKPVIMQTLLNIRSKQLENKQSLMNLDAGELTQLSKGVGAFAQDKDVIDDKTDPDTGVNPGRAKIDSFFDTFGQQSPEAARVAALWQPMVDKTPNKPGALIGQVRSLQLMGEDISGQQAQTNPVPTPVQQGAKVGLFNVNKATGFQHGQQPVATAPYEAPPGVAPSPSGGLQRYGPGGAGLPAAGAAGPGTSQAVTSRLPGLQQPGPNDPAAKWATYAAQLKSNSDLVTAARSAATDPTTGVVATRFNNQQIMDLAPHITSGPAMGILNTMASRLPQSARTSADNYQNVAHYMALNSAAMAQKMGVPNTNLGQETAAAAAGSVERNPATIQEITRTNDALNTGFDLFNRGLAAVSNNGSDPSRVGAYQQAFSRNMDVTALRWADAHRRGDQAEISALQSKPGFNLQLVQQHLRTLKALADTGDLP